MLNRILPLLGLARLARLDSALAAVDEQRERLAALRAELEAAESARDGLAEEVSALTSERDDAQLEASALRWKLERSAKDRVPGPVCLDPEALAKARALLESSGYRSDILDAVGVVIDDAMLAALNTAMDPALEPLAVKHALGMSECCVRLKGELKRLVAEGRRKAEEKQRR